MNQLKNQLNKFLMIMGVLPVTALLITANSARAQVSHTRIQIKTDTIFTEVFEAETAGGGVISELIRLVANRSDVKKSTATHSTGGYFPHNVQIYEVLNEPGAILRIESNGDLGRHVKMTLETGTPLTNVRLVESGDSRKGVSIRGPIAQRLLQILKESGAMYKNGSYSLHGTEATYGLFGTEISDVSCSDVFGSSRINCAIH